MHKELLSTAAIVVTLAAYIPYVFAIRRGEIKPHVFSWVLWGMSITIVFLAMLADGGGLGAWPIGVSALITSYIALLAYRRRADLRITRTDWACFFVALSALPFWFFTSNPLWAVVVMTLVDLSGFGPTARRAHQHPHEESITFFALFALHCGLVLLALENYTVTTMLYQVVVGLACLIMSLMVAWRRHELAGAAGHARGQHSDNNSER